MSQTNVATVTICSCRVVWGFFDVLCQGIMVRMIQINARTDVIVAGRMRDGAVGGIAPSLRFVRRSNAVSMSSLWFANRGSYSLEFSAICFFDSIDIYFI